MRDNAAESISCKAMGAGASVALGRARGVFVAMLKARWSNEFHASHCGHRPSQRGDSNPQAEQK